MASRKLGIRVFVAWIFCICFSIGSAVAQSGQADVEGIVSDSTGATVANAQVTLRNMDSGDSRAVTTEADGRYRFPTVPPGRYSITVKAPSFSSQTVNDLQIELGNHVEQNVALKAGDTSQVVEVTGDVGAVDTTAYDVGGVISQTQMTTLPIPNRQYLNLALLLPGTTQDATRTFYNNVQSGGGQFYYANGFFLDGVSNQWSEQGEPRQNIPEGAVDQFKTYVASFPAEFGWAMGGFTAVVTKSGTNRIHGEVFEYFRNQAFNGENRFQQAADVTQGTGKAPYTRNQFGGDIGGAILKDRTHYYAAYERTQTTASYTLFVPPASAANYAPLLGTFSQPSHDQMLTLRLDHNLKTDQQLFVRYAQEWNLLTRQGCGGSTTYSCYDGSIPRHSIVVGHTWEPTSHIVNEARFQYAISTYQLGPYGTTIPKTPNDLLSPQFTNAVGIGYRFPSFSYGETYSAVGVESRWELNDSLSIQKGTHSFKMGFDISYIPYVDASAVNLKGTFTFGTDQPFNPANTSNLTNPSSFTAALKPLIYYLPSTQTSYFFQDTWKLRPNLTANLGLRYDREYGASFLDTLNPANFTPAIPFQGDPRKRGDRNNFGPRIGFTWDPNGKGQNVIRAGYGVYYNNIQTEQGEGEKLNLYACNVTISNPKYPDPYNGLSPSTYCSTAPPTVSFLSPGYSNPYSQQFSAGYTRQITTNLALIVDGIYEHGLRNYKVIDLNYPVNGVRPLPTWNQLQQHASTDQDKYKGLFVRLDKRYSGRFMYSVAYTLSSGSDWNPEVAIVTYSNPKADFGPSGIDRRHAIVASGSVMLPWKIQLGGIYTFRSAEPFSVTTNYTSNVSGKGADGNTYGPVNFLNGDSAATFVPGTTRNQGNRGISYSAINAFRTQINNRPENNKASYVPLSANLDGGSIASTKYNDFDLRISKSFFVKEQRKLEIIGQAFNLFGFTNYNAIQTSGTSATLGQATNAGTVQQGEVAARFTF